MCEPKILIISNDCLSLSNSNGRTLRNFLVGWSKDKLAQFALRSNDPDWDVCANYFCVSDKQALRAFLGRGYGGGPIMPLQDKRANAPTGKKTERTALTMLLRELVWNSRRWTKNGFWRWVEDFAPQLVLLQAGDCGFMFRLAEDLARKYNIPLVIYNSEGYYFKKFDYFQGRGLAHWCYPVFHKIFSRQFERTVHHAACSVYACKPLQDDYDAALGLPSHTMYTATEVKPEAGQKNPVFTTSYLGNLGVGRHQPLIEIANALQSISNELYLDVYGKIPNDAVQAVFDACPGIRYKGFVSYEQVVEIMYTSDLLVHAENFSDFYREDLKYAFSTKLADSLACGTCFLVYAPEEMACARYLRDNEVAWVVSNGQALTEVLTKLVNDPVAREQYLVRASQVISRNHLARKNSNEFQKILKTAVYGE